MIYLGVGNSKVLLCLCFQAANISRYAANFRGSKFMLIHGTADGKYLYTSDVIYIIHGTADGKYPYTSDVI